MASASSCSCQPAGRRPGWRHGPPRGLSDLGGFLDIVLDFIVYAGMPFAFALADPAANGLAAAFLVFAFMGTGSSFLAFAVMAAKRGLATELRGRKSLYYLGGLTEGTETILFLVAWPACFPRSFAPLALGFAVACAGSPRLGRMLAGFQLKNMAIGALERR